MLKVYDKAHNSAGYIPDFEIHSLHIESEVSDGDKTLSFTCLNRRHGLESEYYLQTEDDEYVVKEISENSDGFPDIVAALNLEGLQQSTWETFSVQEATIDAAAKLVLAGTGWTVGTCGVTKKRNAGMMNVNSLEAIQNLCTAFMCEPVFDTIAKTVSFYEERGEDRGAYLVSGLNLKRLKKKSSSYDYYTRIIPIGADSLSIESVNDGKNYLENYQYSDKVLTYIWKDESYTDADALKEDAEKKLADLSKPEVSYEAEIRDLAKQKDEYRILSYQLGDTVTLIDPVTGTRDKQRIKKLVEYPLEPEKNTCELANTVLTFEDMQEKLKAAAEIIDFTITGDGQYTGTISVSDILHFEEGLANSETVSTISSDISALSVRIGSVETNYLKAEEAELKYATIESLAVSEAEIQSLEATYAEFSSTVTDELAAHTAIINSLSTTYATIDSLDATNAVIESLGTKYANIDFSNIEMAAVEQLFTKSGIISDLTVGEASITGKLVGVTITGDLIEANTIVADKLVVQGEGGLYYKLNVSGESVAAEQTEYNSLNGSIITVQSITADKIQVTDLVAFGATIGGFTIGTSCIYSGVKESVDNTTTGVYMDSSGQFALGDANSYIRYYLDSDGTYKLAIAAASLTFAATGKSVEEEIADLKEEITTTLYISSSRGTVFRNDNISTVLSVVVYYGAERITDLTALKEAMGDSVYLQWSFQRFGDDETIYQIDAGDPRISNDGFTFTVSPDDVDAKAVFLCDLMKEEEDGNS